MYEKHILNYYCTVRWRKFLFVEKNDDPEENRFRSLCVAFMQGSYIIQTGSGAAVKQPQPK